MKIFFKQPSGMTFVELIISIAIFSQIILVVGMVVMKALEFNEFNKNTKSVNIELYSSVMNGIGPYIRKATGIMYDNYTASISTPAIENLENIKTQIHTSEGENSFDRMCTETDADVFDRITLFQDKEKKEYILFGVEKNETENTSRLVWKKNNEPAFYLTSENTYVSCFLVSVSPNPYGASNKNVKDIQPYIQIALAGRYRYLNDTKEEDFLKKNTYTSYKTTFTLRNYSY